jgi:hypothetical protein
MNSYQKLKKQNQDLIKQLMIVCCDNDSYNARLICEKYRTIKSIETALWFGEYLKEEYGQYKGVGIVTKLSNG